MGQPSTALEATAFSVAVNTHQTKKVDMNTRQKKSIGQNRTPTERPVANVVAAPEGVVGHYPLSSVFVAFGLGLAVGVALGASIGGPVAPRPSWGRRTELAAENLGRHMRDAIASVLPETLSKHIA